MSQIRGILFDSGDTLVRPKAGSWFPKQHVLDAFDAHGITGVRMDRYASALAVGIEYLEVHHRDAIDEDIERRQFREAYRLILEDLGIASPGERLIADILSPFENDVGIESFPDTVQTLEMLRRRGFRLGIVSDNWPSLDWRYRELVLRPYFQAFVISALVGCSKPCAPMYQTGIDQIRLEPDRVLFVDDSVENVRGAIRQGMQGVVINRYRTPIETDLAVVSDLGELTNLIL